MPQAIPIESPLEQATNYFLWLVSASMLLGLGRGLYALRASKEEARYLEEVQSRILGLEGTSDDMQAWIQQHLYRLQELLHEVPPRTNVAKVLFNIQRDRVAIDEHERLRQAIVVAISKRLDDSRRRRHALLNPLNWLGLGVAYAFQIPTEALRAFGLKWDVSEHPIVRKILGFLTAVLWFFLTKMISDTYTFNLHALIAQVSRGH